MENGAFLDTLGCRIERASYGRIMGPGGSGVRAVLQECRGVLGRDAAEKE